MSIYKKLFEAKKEIGKISKDSKNPFFKSKYFDVNSLLEHVEPILQKHDLLLLQPIVDSKVSTIIIDVESGDQTINSVIQLPQIQDPQKLGSAITYYRRYTLQSLLGLQAEDDDGNKASNRVNNQKANSVPTAHPTANDYKKCKTQKELKQFYASLPEEQQKSMFKLITEFGLTLKN